MRCAVHQDDTVHACKQIKVMKVGSSYYMQMGVRTEFSYSNDRLPRFHDAYLSPQVCFTDGFPSQFKSDGNFVLLSH